MTLLEENLRRLSEADPILHEFLSAHLERAPDRELAAGGSLAPEVRRRSVTLVRLGIDRSLLRLIAQIEGDTNLLVVDDEPGRLLALLSSFTHDNLFVPGMIRWVLTPEMLAPSCLERFFLGSVEILPPACPSAPPPLALLALGRIRDLYAGLTRDRVDNPHTYLTMITFNRLQLTQLTLNRLRINTVTPLRLIIIDNGSTDGTRQWLASAARDYEFVDRVILMKENVGVGRALNNGLLYSLSRSNRVGRIDNDILVPPFWLRDLNHVLDSTMRPAIVGGVVTDDKYARCHLSRATATLVDDLKVYSMESLGGCCNVYDPTLFRRFGLFTEFPLYGVEDGGLCRAVREQGLTIAAVDNVKLEHLSSIIREDPQYRTMKCSHTTRFKEMMAQAR